MIQKQVDLIRNIQRPEFQRDAQDLEDRFI